MSPTETTDAAKTASDKTDTNKTETNKKDIKREISVEIPAAEVARETERQIQEAIDRLVQGRTVFAIAHRLSTLRRASRLFVIEHGRLAEAGTHAELLAIDDGIYRRLYELQLQLH